MLTHSYFTIIVLEILLCSISCNNASPKFEVKTIEVRSLSPLMGETYYKIHYSNEHMIMYESQYLRDSSETQFHIDSSTHGIYVEDTLLTHQWRNRFFVFHVDSTYGYRYDPHGLYSTARLAVDSELVRTTGTNTFEAILKLKPDTSLWNKNKSELIEVYILPKEKSKPEGRVRFFYSTNLNHLPYSLNKQLDSAKKMKFFKISFLFKEFYNEKTKTNFPSTIDETELKESRAENLDEIMRYFEMYEKIIRKK